jgi:eukaryotic-like serine/threonine-protein kinase
MVSPFTSEEELASRRFLVRHKLGEGGMGTVYEAVDHERGTRVALKTLRQLSPEHLLRFKGEFRKLQDLHHPNLVSLGELVEEEGRWFFTMELVQGCDFLLYVRALPTSEEPTQEGSRPTDTGSASAPSATARPHTGSLDEPTVRLDRQPEPLLADKAPSPQPLLGIACPFDERRLRSALGQLALGLHALHRVGKVHRDIKPSNILVTEQGRVVLLDFGILSDMQGDETWEPWEVVGTAGYMAPEQTRGVAPSPQADWYSVGVLLYLALTGRKPFQGSAEHVMELKRRVEPVPPQQLLPGLPEDLCLLCTELLRLLPEQRPTGEQVLRRLGLEQQARAEAWSAPVLPFVGRHPERQALHAALARSRQGNSVVVRVEGESGVGKTRLVRHFLEEVAREVPDVVVLSSRCYERESVPFKGVDGLIDALTRYLSGRGRDEAHQVLPQDTTSLACLFPTLRQVPGVPEAPAPPLRGDPLRLRVAAFAALRELLTRLAQRHPVVLSIDDLQWADLDSAVLLEEVLQAPGLLLVATVRVGTETGPTSEVASSRFWEQAQVLVLEGLPAHEAQGLVEQFLGSSAPPQQALARRIAQESGGHPLLLEVLVRHQQLGEERSGEAAPRPLRLEEALWARVERLEPQARQLLELLAVATGPLSHQVAGHAMALEPAQYTPLASSLRAARMAFTTGPAAQDSIELLHDRIRQALAPRLAALERRSWHTRLASSLEVLGHGSAEALAHHWHEAGHPERAVHYYLRAAQEAAEALAFSRAARLYGTALALGPWEPAEQRRLRLSQAEALSHAGRCAEAAQAFLAAAEGAPAAEALALRRSAAAQYLTCGLYREGLGVVREVLAAQGLRYPETLGETMGALFRLELRSMLHRWRLQPREPGQVPTEALERLETLYALSSRLGGVEPLRSYVFRSHHRWLALKAGDCRHLCLALCADIEAKALAGPRYLPRLEWLTEQLLSLAARLPEDTALQGMVAAALTWKGCFLGEYTSAWPHFERALALLQRCRRVDWELTILWRAGVMLLVARGELATVSRHRDLLVAEANERHDVYRRVLLSTGFITLSWLGEDDPEGARKDADEALRLWAECNPQNFHVQGTEHLISHLYVDLYEGQERQALQRLEEAWPRLRRTGLLFFPAIVGSLLVLQARARMMELAQGGEATRKRLRAAQAEARRLERLKLVNTRAEAELVRAGVAAAQGSPEAAECYERAIAALEACGQLLQAAAARLRLGELRGGTQGQALAEEALLWMRQRGIARPEALASVFAPPMRAALSLPPGERQG